MLLLAQFFGIELTLAQQLMVMFVCILGGIGLILGVDRFLDICRTTLNVTGDVAAAVVVSRGEPDGALPVQAKSTSLTL